MQLVNKNSSLLWKIDSLPKNLKNKNGTSSQKSFSTLQSSTH